MKRRLRLAIRTVRSILQAAVFRAMASVGLRGPSRSCQIAELRSILTSCLGKLERGRFVEVGAYDGEKFSNTSWLADNGWRGLYVEPSPEFARLCRLRHCLNDVVVVNAAAGEQSGDAVLMQMGSLSTMSASTFDAYQSIPWAKAQMNSGLEQKSTRVETLDSILESNNFAADFDVLVVDVEGFEESVFRSFDLRRWRPRVMIVELCDVHDELNTTAELAESARRVRSQIVEAGYVEVYRDHINTVFAIAAGTAMEALPPRRKAA
ncbi:MAG: hypothetical protein RL215_1582 [Planctomycetota bacterium]